MSAPSVHFADIQANVFTRWINDELKRRGMRVDNLETDLKDGVLLINLLEEISGESLGRYNKHPRIISQKMENLNIALDFLQNKHGIKMVNIGSDDIHSGNIRIILGLCWHIILFFEICRGQESTDDASNDLLRWLQSKLPHRNLTGFTKDWNDGTAVCELVEVLRPGHFPNFAELDPNDKMNNARQGIDAADRIGVDKLIMPEEMTHPKVNKMAMMTYLAQFRNLPPLMSDASRVRAYGPGLVEGIANQDAKFTVEHPSDVTGKIEVKVEGPQDDAHVDVEPVGDGKYNVSYLPTAPGNYRVHVTLDGEHIPGSIFSVTVLEKESLGGEGKIRVFYSSSSGNQKVKSDQNRLTTLFETKRVHLRPDFEPWCPLDLLEKPDRDAVFRVAGTRELPIVFVDDRYIGSFDQIQALEEDGRLDEILKIETNANLITEEEHLARLKNMAPDPRDRQKDAAAASSAPAAPGGPAPEQAPSDMCGNCGAARPGGAKFCANCGEKL